MERTAQIHLLLELKWPLHKNAFTEWHIKAHKVVILEINPTKQHYPNCSADIFAKKTFRDS